VTQPRAAAPGIAELRRRARECGGALTRAGRLLVCAESCTGGLIAATCTSIPGSSDWFEGSFVTYQARTKRRMLGVAVSTLQHYGVVSEATAREMAIGALDHSEADIAVSVTGVAGPAGGDVDHPVGTVWFAWASRTDGAVVVNRTAHHVFPGNREQIRRAAVAAALEGVAGIVSRDPIA
jgi:nicotinamide-nucleotide amidase